MFANRFPISVGFHLCLMTLAPFFLAYPTNVCEQKSLWPSVWTLIGSGYDVRVGNPDGSSLLEGGLDPGIMLKNVIQIHDYNMIYCTVFETLTPRTVLIDDLTAYDQELGRYWKILEDPNAALKPALPVSGSLVLNELKTVLETHKQAMLVEEKKWTYGTAAYYETQYFLNEKFQEQLCDLPHTFDDQTRPKFRNFFETWGTHMIVKVVLGSRRIQRHLFTEGDYVQRVFSTPWYKSEIYPKVHALGNKSYVSISNRTASPYSMYYTRTNDIPKPSITFPVLESGSRDIPIPIAVHLKSISAIISESTINNTSQESCLRLNRETLRTNVETAIRDYIGNGETQPREEIIRKIQLLWPSGSYSLPMLNSTECPPHWMTGSRYHHILEKLPPYSSPLEVGFNFHYCSNTKADVTNTAEEGLLTSWDAGSYCIYKKGSCPSGFVEANVCIQDEYVNDDKRHEVHGVLPDGVYDGEATHYELCCRSDSDPSSAIILPTHTPFFLLPTSPSCQQVVGMTSNKQELLFDTSNMEYYHSRKIWYLRDRISYTSSKLGTSEILGDIQPHGSVSSSKDYLQLNFCYYTPQ